MTDNNKPSSSADIGTLLTRHFGFREFHPGQREPIEAVLGGEDAVVVMPTGSGKSLCYQLAAMAMDGITLVVSPLIALMKDQVDGLASRGLAAASLNSSLTSEEAFSRISDLRNGRTKLLYVAPERFRNKGFQNLLAALNVTLLAIDEAHCISQWGHDFTACCPKRQFIETYQDQDRHDSVRARCVSTKCCTNREHLLSNETARAQIR